MKKDRNSFFGSSNFNMSAMGNMDPQMQMPNMPQAPNMGMPNVNAASSNFYAQQNMPVPLPNYNQSVNTNALTELESKIAKLERSINRLEARLNKIEGSTFYTKETYETDGNMYMV